LVSETDDEINDSFFNLRARQVGINQILNVYVPALIMDVNEIYC